MDFYQELKEKAKLIDIHLDNYLKEKENYQSNIYRAMRYSLFAGGKRLRPVILLACCETTGGDKERALPFACAIEMIHTYSLIHDDLPAMDNDDYRRGRLTNHKVFGEAMAILAGDALLNKAFEIMIYESIKSPINLRRAMEAIFTIAKASGTEGMIGGQVVDLESEHRKADEEQLKYMYLYKTGALLIASAKAGAILGGGNASEIEALTAYSSNIGLAFQIKDDILDIEGNADKLGKCVGSDQKNSKSTFVSIKGIQHSKDMVQQLTQEAIQYLNIFGDKGEFLIQLAQYLINREF